MVLPQLFPKWILFFTHNYTETGIKIKLKNRCCECSGPSGTFPNNWLNEDGNLHSQGFQLIAQGLMACFKIRFRVGLLTGGPIGMKLFFFQSLCQISSRVR